MKITCTNPECTKTIHTVSVKLGFPGSGEKKDDKWFCSHKCYRNYLADQFIEDKQCGLRKKEGRLKLGFLLMKNHFITKEQLTFALEKRRSSRKRLGEILVEDGYITEKELKAILSMQAGVAPIILPPKSKVRLKDEIPFKMINEFQFFIFDFDLESKIIQIAVHEMDYISLLEEYFSKIYPDFLTKFYLEEKEMIAKLLHSNYPGKPLSVEVTEELVSKEKEIKDTQLDKLMMKFKEFLFGLSGNDAKIDNLDNAVWIKSETKEFKIDIYLTMKNGPPGNEEDHQ